MNAGPHLRRMVCITAATLAAICLVPGAAGAGASQVDLIGSWFVLIHYRDSATADPDADRWEDKVWTFEREGSRLRWIEYPIVVFEENEGRFGPVGRNPKARQ